MGSYTNGLTSEATGFSYDDYYLAKPYLKALRDGEVSEDCLNDQASRILRLIFRTAMNRSKPYGEMTTQRHYDACRQIAAEGIVLLKNERDRRTRKPLLPIDTTKHKRILVVGENATKNLCEGGGSSELKPRHLVSPLQGMERRFGKDHVAYAKGYASGTFTYDHENIIPQHVYDSLRAEAVAAAAEADIIVFVGGLNKNWRQDCENGDRVSMDLPFSQDLLIEALIATGKPLVAVFLTGNAYAMPWLKDVPAVVQAWYMGTEGGSAIADVLSGDVAPSGKLPFSFPARLQDCAPHSFDKMAYPGDSVREIYREDILVGYRWHDTKRVPPLFPFGHGLSYVTFTYGKASVALDGDSKWTVSVPVTNNGTMEASEVVQLYVGDDKCTVLRPKKELKAFAKVKVKPGATATATMSVSRDDLMFWSEKDNGWKLEPGTFTLYIGSSSADIRQKLKIAVR